ncbi:hypothetical protein SCARR_00123 [Pontiella sulfatireligans]|uniref:Uncharacterized protein n=1 Tax=Pontiella sulfatireligans TaxID=2750658 RepID=A0A6C2UD00_9BACT|nr:hypothetical protein SCARR_00123 [Pontiella sulfatireligans]
MIATEQKYDGQSTRGRTSSFNNGKNTPEEFLPLVLNEKSWCSPFTIPFDLVLSDL